MNKLWNSSRFLMMNIENKNEIIPFENLDDSLFELVDLWILSRLNQTIKDANQNAFLWILFTSIVINWPVIRWLDDRQWYREWIKQEDKG